jgi:prephenate dehydratase
MKTDKLGMLGPLGTFTAQAGEIYCRREGLAKEYALYGKIEDCFDAVETGDVHHAIVPLLNSTSEAAWVNETLVGLRKNGLRIYDEVILPIRHNLLGVAGASLEDLKGGNCYVHSKNKALQQCGDNLSKLLGEYTGVSENSTAKAAEYIASLGQNNRMAIATEMAAGLYGLDILARGVEDVSGNKTRFVVINKEDHERTGYDKTSILFEFGDVGEPALLSGVLNSLTRRNLNLLYIQSLPKAGSLDEFTFYCDIEGHRSDGGLEEALGEMGSGPKMSYWKILGSYPRYAEAA